MAENAPAPRVQPAPRVRLGEENRAASTDLEENRRIQRELQAAGYDLGPNGVDGRIGKDTREAYNKLMADRREAERRDQEARQESQRLAAEKAKADAAAQAAKAAAEAEQQKAQAELIRAQAAAEKAKADASAAEAARKAKEEQDQRDRVKQAEQAAQDNQKQLNKALLNIGLPVVGIAAGHLIAKQIEKGHNASVEARGEQLKALAGDVSKQIAKGEKLKGAAKTASNKRLAGMVQTADNLKLTKTTAPLGIAAAATLVIDGAIARFVVAPFIKDEVTAEAVRAGGTALALTGSAMVGHMALSRASPSVVPDAKALAVVEQARALTTKPTPKPRTPKGAPPPPPVAQSPLVKAGVQAAKWLAPVVAAGAAAVAMTRAASAGESTGEVVKQGAAAGADVLTAGAVTTYDEAKAEGDSSLLAGVKAVAKAAVDLATFGVGTLALDAGARTREQLRDMAAQRDAKSSGPPVSPRSAEVASMTAYLNEEARQRAEAMPPPVAAAPPPINVAMPAADGTTDGYTATRRTKSGLIQVQVGSYRTPAR